jgi:hypothetical protein
MTTIRARSTRETSATLTELYALAQQLAQGLITMQRVQNMNVYTCKDCHHSVNSPRQARDIIHAGHCVISRLVAISPNVHHANALLVTHRLVSEDDLEAIASSIRPAEPGSQDNIITSGLSRYDHNPYDVGDSHG